jgi:hypothetical protein
MLLVPFRNKQQKPSDTYHQVFFLFILSQQALFSLISLISVLFDGKLHYLKIYNGYCCMLLVPERNKQHAACNMVVNLTTLHLVITYFQHFPLNLLFIFSIDLNFAPWLSTRILFMFRNMQQTVHGLDKIS